MNWPCVLSRVQQTGCAGYTLKTTVYSQSSDIGWKQSGYDGPTSIIIYSTSSWNTSPPGTRSTGTRGVPGRPSPRPSTFLVSSPSPTSSSNLGRNTYAAGGIPAACSCPWCPCSPTSYSPANGANGRWVGGIQASSWVFPLCWTVFHGVAVSVYPPNMLLAFGME